MRAAAGKAGYHLFCAVLVHVLHVFDDRRSHIHLLRCLRLKLLVFSLKAQVKQQPAVRRDCAGGRIDHHDRKVELGITIKIASGDTLRLAQEPQVVQSLVQLLQCASLSEEILDRFRQRLVADLREGQVSRWSRTLVRLGVCSDCCSRIFSRRGIRR